MGVAENKAVAQRLFNEMWNGGRFDMIDDLFAPEGGRGGE